jgi:hypothetical protein
LGGAEEGVNPEHDSEEHEYQGDYVLVLCQKVSEGIPEVLSWFSLRRGFFLGWVGALTHELTFVPSWDVPITG